MTKGERQYMQAWKTTSCMDAGGEEGPREEGNVGKCEQEQNG